MSRILLIEDDPTTALVVVHALNGSGIQLTSAQSLRESDELLASAEFDLVLLDLHLGDGDGLKFFSEWTARSGKRIPYICLTGDSEVTSIMAAFQLGTDDYIVKPFHPLELRARIEGRLKRIRELQGTQERLAAGPLEIDILAQRALIREGHHTRSIDLTTKEFKLLHLLVRNKGNILSRQQLLDSVWGDGVHVSDRTVDAHIYCIRQKLADKGPLIEAVIGAGYRFNAHPEVMKKSS